MAENGEKRMLIAMDGSKYADYAFDWYLKNVHRPEYYVIVLYIVEFHSVASMPMGVGAAELLSKMIEEEKEQALSYLDALKKKMADAQLHGKVKEVSGSPRTEIIRVAEEEKVSLIITGSRGMGTVKRTLLGSVSDHVLHHSHVPVLVCRHKDDH